MFGEIVPIKYLINIFIL